MSTTTLSLDEIHSLICDCLVANGCDDENAAAVARTIGGAERDGAAAHGLFRLRDTWRRCGAEKSMAALGRRVTP